jgi:PadR family transcriptional regulator, regulatory protein PadR
MTSLSRREEQVLLSIWTLKDNAYLISIKTHLSELTKSEWSISAVQKPLLQLERKGFITTFMGESSNIRGGRRKKMCKITLHGTEALKSLRQEQEVLWKEFMESELKIV